LVLVFQILVAVVILVGLITVIMSVKNWHWAQMLLLLGIFFSSIGVLFLGLEVYRIHRTFQKRMPQLEEQLAQVELKNDALRSGTGDRTVAQSVFPEMPFDIEAETRMPGLSVWAQRLQDEARQRGRVWRGVVPAGPVDAVTSRVPVKIEPQPHGLEKDAIVYVFEQGAPNAANPAQGPQYLGEFKVAEVRPDGVTLESVIKLDTRTGPRVVASITAQRPWTLYETMPADSHEMFAGLDEAKLRELLPAASVEEYIRQGQPVEKPNANEAFDPTIAMVDEQGHRVGPDDADKAQKWFYDRQLRDYAYLFAAANRRLVELVASRTALQEDLKKLAEANKIGQKFFAQRTEEKQALTTDKEHMLLDQKAAEELLATVERQLANARQLLADAQATNSQIAAQLKAEQLQMLERANVATPAPAAVSAP
jgi:hypothetical protein